MFRQILIYFRYEQNPYPGSADLKLTPAGLRVYHFTTELHRQLPHEQRPDAYKATNPYIRFASFSKIPYQPMRDVRLADKTTLHKSAIVQLTHKQ